MQRTLNFLVIISAFLLPSLLNAQCFEENLSHQQPAEASSVGSSGAVFRVNDGNLNSLWTSETAEPQWIYVDLGIISSVCAITIKFESLSFPTAFEIQLSDDAENWETILSITDNAANEVLYEDLAASGRYVRLFCISSIDPELGFGVYEMRVFGSIEAPYQVLTFNSIANRLSTDGPFELQAESTSGLPTSFTIVGGPASIEGNLLTMTGEGGLITVRASQEGNGDFFAAEPKEQSFTAIDPVVIYPEVVISNPSDALGIAMPELGQITISAIGKIQHPQWFSIEGATFEINGNLQSAYRGSNGSFYLDWEVPDYGMHTITVQVTASNGNSTTETINFEVVTEGTDQQVRAFDHDEIIAFVNPTFVGTYHLPTQVGAYNKITANLSITCPDVGCDAWDRLAHVEVRAPNGEWVEIIRYITPFGVPCNHSIDVTDFSSILQGFVEIRMYISTFQRGWEITLDFDYEAGAPEYRYSKVEKLWYGSHPFGLITNRQPADTFMVEFEQNVMASKLKLVTTGHGWGPNNTGNAAEFYNATHHVRINNNDAFEQHNWIDCDPNPDGCQPQNGTWRFDRAGWCPGAISPWFEYELNPYLNDGPLEMTYRFDVNYTDFCHPSNPSCAPTITCPNCNDGFNPSLSIAGNLITYSNTPISSNILTFTLETPGALSDLGLSVYPNPSSGLFTLELQNEVEVDWLRIYNYTGKLVLEKPGNIPVQAYSIDLSAYPKGIYLLNVLTKKGMVRAQLIVD